MKHGMPKIARSCGSWKISTWRFACGHRCDRRRSRGLWWVLCAINKCSRLFLLPAAPCDRYLAEHRGEVNSRDSTEQCMCTRAHADVTWVLGVRGCTCVCRARTSTMERFLCHDNAVSTPMRSETWDVVAESWHMWTLPVENTLAALVRVSYEDAVRWLNRVFPAQKHGVERWESSIWWFFQVHPF